MFSWCDVMNWFKDKCLEFLDSNKVNQKDKKFPFTQYFETGTHQGENIEVTKMPLFNELHLCSSGGKNVGEGVADKFHLFSREELWKTDLEGCDKAKKSKGREKTKASRSSKW